MWPETHRIICRIAGASQLRSIRLVFFQKLTEAVEVNPTDVPLKPGT
jgi:hypothetical protein